MANTRHAIIRTDLLAGTDVGAYLGMGRYLGSDGVTPAAIDNGNVVKIGGLIGGERDLRVYTTPAANTPIDQIGIVATPERFYDGLTHAVKDYENAEGLNLRVYLLAGMTTSSCFTVTADGFTIAAGATPAKGWVAELQAGTKLKLVATATAGSTVVGKVIGITKLEGVEAYTIGKEGN
jgi:hypothetical protein